MPQKRVGTWLPPLRLSPGALRGQEMQRWPSLPLRAASSPASLRTQGLAPAVRPMERTRRHTGLPWASPFSRGARPRPSHRSCCPYRGLRSTRQPTHVAAIPHLRGPQRLGELAPGTGSRLVADLLSHERAVLKAAEVHATLRGCPSARGLDTRVTKKRGCRSGWTTTPSRCPAGP